ncbi:MAG: transcriptional repressor LexA [Patescibacteria group bacterium]|nr:transcriptional repressor LexA [Patescibacteria group bacterium]
MGQLPTKRQKQLLKYLETYIERRGYSPTYEEMAEALDVNSVATIFDHLRELSKKGYIKIYSGAVRGIEILDADIKSKISGIKVELPLLGYIAAGKPIEVITQRETVLVSPGLISGHKKAFVLKVKGESMIEEGILDGDYVVVEEQETAENGEIVVAVLPGGFATLKKYYREKDRIRLAPANSKMKPIYCSEVKIEGVVKGIIRRF